MSFFFRKLILLIHLYFNHVILLHPHDEDKFISNSTGCDQNRVRPPRKDIPVDNFWATGGLRVNSSPVKVKLIIFSLFVPEGNTILPITPKAVCETSSDFQQNVEGDGFPIRRRKLHTLIST